MTTLPSAIQPGKTRQRWLYWVFLTLGVVAVAIIAWFLFHKKATATPKPPPVPVSVPPSTSSTNSPRQCRPTRFTRRQTRWARRWWRMRRLAWQWWRACPALTWMRRSDAPGFDRSRFRLAPACRHGIVEVSHAGARAYWLDSSAGRAAD